MAERTPAQQQRASAGQETVIRLVLTGPAAAPDADAELALLRERVTTLERALADADGRIEAIAQAVAQAIAAVPVAPVTERVELLLRDAARRSASDEPPAAPVLQPTGDSQPPPPADAAAPKVRGLRRMVTALKPH